ncbi:MAG: S-methyl-5-thioribose-1-phosphate isomerase [Betaproteobacteria bacterium]
MKVGGKSFRSIWTANDENAGTREVHIIDQARLPFTFETLVLRTRDETAHAIRAMQVRGAPLIGVTAAFGVALAMRQEASDTALKESIALLQATRPTAVNLAWALAAMNAHLVPLAPASRADAAWRLARTLADDDVATNEAIGNHGCTLLRAMHESLQRPVNVLTHCNAGWVATVDWGTALSCIYKAHEAGIPLHVWVDETRPRNQGLLTAWELREQVVPHTYIVDNAGGHMMQHGKVDVVLVGADRVSRAGDVANKIGTYLKALAAHDNGIPFYAALPVSTIDPALNDALAEIEIEERGEAEVRSVIGLQAENGSNTAPALILHPDTRVSNPGFDVTPSRLVTGIITERGVFSPAQLAANIAPTSP